jgi:hypothetical protein
MARRRERRRGDRGVVAVLSVFFVILLLTILAVSINLGRLTRTRGDLQHATDSAVTAAVESLDNKPAGGPVAGRTAADFDSSPTATSSVPAVAEGMAQHYLLMNSFGQIPTVAKDADLLYGFWHLRVPGGFIPTKDHCVFKAGNCDQGWEPGPADPSTNLVQAFAVNTIILTTHYSLPPYFGNFLMRGNTNMNARATAIGRRTKVPCAIPSAVSVCQIVDATGAGNGFVCPGGTLFKSFTSNEYMDPNALGRIDLVNQWNPASENPQFMRLYTRAEDFDHCMNDAATLPTPVTEYLSGDGLMPNVERANLQPVVHALLGIQNDPPAGSQQAGRCLLGRTLVIPVVQPIGIQSPADCANVCQATNPVPSPPLPATAPAGVPGGCIPWPATGVQRVVGFVNITFTAIHCWHETDYNGAGFVQPTITQANCYTALDTQPGFVGQNLANRCANLQGVDFMTQQALLRVDANITCDPPTDPFDVAGNPITGNLLKPRLVR